MYLTTVLRTGGYYTKGEKWLTDFVGRNKFQLIEEACNTCGYKD